MKKHDFEIQMAAHSSKLETAISKTSALDGEVAELRVDFVLETSADKSFPMKKVTDLVEETQAELTQDAANDLVIMDKMVCGCVSNRKELTESTATAEKQIVNDELEGWSNPR